MLKRVYIETYGCQMNVADSELMFGVLHGHGFARAEHPEDADVMLVNTCAVRDNAEQRVIGRMGELQRYKRPGGVLGVVGCMAQRLGPTLLARVPRVDLVV
ncbi:MAG TPA: tRNA (N6-isopentenyl adenosine(37)-C2)-methylthiotransferase MiaB, partial [Gemmatimonadales bacterium]|nr:tRNA (N6-isopentenyl adenosine(37)-C2)-methylthiotransferase MiaB [Gemmatimonadales bacterium]